MEISSSIVSPSQGTAAPGVQALAETPVLNKPEQGTQKAAGEQEKSGEGQPQGEQQKLPVTLEDKPEPAKVPNAGEAGATYSYEPTGDAGLDYALDFIGKQGYGDSHPAVIAATNGDFSLLEAELATKNVPGAQQIIALAKQAHERHVQADSKREAELSSFAAQAAGGAENWATVRAWAATEATPEEKAQVNAALRQGGIIAQGVISQLVSLYTQRHTLPKEAQEAARPNASPQSGSSGEPMTAQRYAREVEALRQKLGNRTETSAEYAALQGQRLAARRQGI